MTKAMSTCVGSLALLFAVFLSLMPEQAACGGFFLVDGVGLQGQMEIGMAAPKSAKESGSELGWYNLDKLPIYFKKATDGRIAIIRCDNYCLTTRSISIGSSVREVLWRYGTPAEEKLLDGKKFLTYSGVGFLLDTKGTIVEKIFIFPMAIEKQAK